MKKKYEQKQEALQFVFPPENTHTQSILKNLSTTGKEREDIILPDSWSPFLSFQCSQVVLQLLIFYGSSALTCTGFKCSLLMPSCLTCFL